MSQDLALQLLRRHLAYFLIVFLEVESVLFIVLQKGFYIECVVDVYDDLQNGYMFIRDELDVSYLADQHNVDFLQVLEK